MGKSIYSLVLDDNLVALLDRAANKSGKSRSAIVNEILARELSFETAEMRMRNMLCSMHDLLSGCENFGVDLQDTSLMLRSVLSYRYNPTVRYTLEMQDDICILRVSVRSRAAHFMYMYELFIMAWINDEKQCRRDDLCEYADGRFTRRMHPKTDDMNEFSSAISEYIQAFDAALKQFFEKGGGDDGKAAVSVVYTDYIMRNNNIVL